MDAYLRDLFRKLVSDDVGDRLKGHQDLVALDVDSKGQIIPRLIRALENEDMRSLAANALEIIGRTAVPDLLRLTRDETKDKVARHLAKLIVDKTDWNSQSDE